MPVMPYHFELDSYKLKRAEYLTNLIKIIEYTEDDDHLRTLHWEACRVGTILIHQIESEQENATKNT